MEMNTPPKSSFTIATTKSDDYGNFEEGEVKNQRRKCKRNWWERRRMGRRGGRGEEVEVIASRKKSGYEGGSKEEKLRVDGS